MYIDTPVLTDSTFKMNPTLKAMWVTALRSGEWKQASRAWQDVITANTTYVEYSRLLDLPIGSLEAQQELKHCCLSVLINVDARRKGTDHKDKLSASYRAKVFEDLAVSLVIEGKPAPMVLLRHPNDGWLQMPLISAFMAMNDTMGYTFKQIADWIDANL